jgi:FtsP/CotA-like multicopper oxidase with cupredoxin domain
MSGLPYYLFCGSLTLIACGADGPAPLPVIAEIPTAEDLNPDPHILEIDLRASETQVELKPGTSTTVMAYNDRIPGPLLQARVGDRVIVHFQNDLGQPTTIHWHGLRISSEMDGSPMIQDPVPDGGSFTYDFILPDPGTYWFHPHFQTIEQIDRGLYGAIVVAEKEAPKFTAERVFVLDDIRLDSANQISTFNYSGHDVMMGRLGNTLLVNGRTDVLTGVAPILSAERWRLVSASTARVLEVSVEGATWRVIASDGGLLPEPYSTKRILIAPGQRYDLEVIYNVDVPAVRLLAHVLDAQNQEVARPLVEYTIQGATSLALPVYPIVSLPELPAAPLEKEIRLGANNDGFTINGAVGSNDHTGHTMLEQFTQGVPVKLTIVNEIGPYHPFHLHGQFFQILERNGRPANEPGLKDTVLLDSMDKVTIVSYFDNPGRWMYHCHIPEHAEFGMMAELDVVPATP